MSCQVVPAADLRATTAVVSSVLKLSVAALTQLLTRTSSGWNAAAPHAVSPRRSWFELAARERVSGHVTRHRVNSRPFRSSSAPLRA